MDCRISVRGSPSRAPAPPCRPKAATDRFLRAHLGYHHTDWQRLCCTVFSDDVRMSMAICGCARRYTTMFIATKVVLCSPDAVVAAEQPSVPSCYAPSLTRPIDETVISIQDSYQCCPRSWAK